MPAVVAAVVGVQDRQDLLLGGIDLAQACRLSPEKEDPQPAGETLQGGHRHEHPVVDGPGEAGDPQHALLLRSQHAHHFELEPCVDGYQRPERRLVREQLGRDLGTQYGYLALQAFVIGVEEPALRQAHRACRKVVVQRAVERRVGAIGAAAAVPSGKPVDHHFRRHRGHRVGLGVDLLHVLDGDPLGLVSLPVRVHRPPVGHHHQGAGAEAGDRVAHHDLGAVAESDDRDHRAHADGDAQHRQHGAKPVGGHRGRRLEDERPGTHARQNSPACGRTPGGSGRSGDTQSHAAVSGCYSRLKATTGGRRAALLAG